MSDMSLDIESKRGGYRRYILAYQLLQYSSLASIIESTIKLSHVHSKYVERRNTPARASLRRSEWTYRKRTLISFDLALILRIIVKRPTLSVSFESSIDMVQEERLAHYAIAYVTVQCSE